MQTLRWMRVPGNTIFALGASILVAFLFSTYSTKQPQAQVAGVPVAVPAAD